MNTFQVAASLPHLNSIKPNKGSECPAVKLTIRQDEFAGGGDTLGCLVAFKHTGF